MANDTKVTISKGGEGEETEEISKINIPDLWHIAETIRGKDSICFKDEAADRILEVWKLAHDFKRHIQES